MATKRPNNPPKGGNNGTSEVAQAGLVRGAEDTQLAAKLGQAIRSAMGNELSQSELARRTNIDQPTISKLIRGVRTTPLTVWEMLTIERATGRPPGWLISQAGIANVANRSARDLILGDASLPQLARKMLLAAYEAALAGGLPDSVDPSDPDSIDRLATALMARLQPPSRKG